MNLNYKSIAAAGIGFGIISVASQGFITPEVAIENVSQSVSVSGAPNKNNFSYPEYTNKQNKQNKHNELEDEEVIIEMMTAFLNTRPRS